MNVVLLGSFTGMAVQRLFQPASALFQPASTFLVLVQRPGVQLSHLGERMLIAEGLVRHVELHN